MLTPDEIAAHVGQLSWFPGWHLRVTEDRKGRTRLLVFGTLRNAYRPDEYTVGYVDPPIPAVDTLAEFDDWLVHRLDRVAIHESREWLRRNGRPVADPH